MANPRLPRMPRLPRLGELLPNNPLDDVRQVLGDLWGFVDSALDDIRSLRSDLSISSDIALANPTSTVPSAGVNDTETFKYQLDHVLQPLRQLELHLAEGCRIAGKPCDCCAKSAMDIRTFSTETIPIAARQGKDAEIFAEIASWASQIEGIGSPQQVGSGEYDATYLSESGTASKYRKQVQAMIAECQECAALENLKTYIERRRTEGKVPPST